MKRFQISAVGASALVLATIALLGAAAPALADEQLTTKHLDSSYYTNGTLKHFTWTEPGDFSACGVLSENYFTVYYDILSTTKIHITSMKVQYYVKGPAGSGVYGGWAIADQGSGSSQRLGTFWADYNTLYKFNSATRDAEGYSYVGSYTHVGPLTITGRKALIEKETTIYRPVTNCTTDFNYSMLQVTW
jgi:hypothetical protein